MRIRLAIAIFIFPIFISGFSSIYVGGSGKVGDVQGEAVG